ncbi:hypothetical protein H9P43_006069 [Blastocladiella emersonii ATCC 22665]|nr:hypothetical protein H9P43_006069 [Blastocladiella emersonii ATCC 22665]
MKQKKKTTRKRTGDGPRSAGAGQEPAVEPTLTCATLTLDDTADPYLPYGQSYPRDLFFYHNPRFFRRLDALVFQCGDLRDVAFTFDEAKRKYDFHCDHTYVLSDTHPEVIARNLLVLHAVAGSADFRLSVLVRYVGQLFYSLLLEPHALAFWRDQMQACLTTDWTKTNAKIRVLDDDTLRAVRHCWESWLACDWSPAKLTEEREAYFARVRPDGETRDHVQVAVNRIVARMRSTYGDELLNEIELGHVRLLGSAPWPDMRELWSSIRTSPWLTACAAEIFAQAQLYGFPIDVDNMLKDKYVYRLEELVDREQFTSVAGLNPLFATVLEISLG